MMISEFCVVNTLHETQLARLYLSDKAPFELLTKKKKERKKKKKKKSSSSKEKK